MRPDTHLHLNVTFFLLATVSEFLSLSFFDVVSKEKQVSLNYIERMSFIMIEKKYYYVVKLYIKTINYIPRPYH